MAKNPHRLVRAWVLLLSILVASILWLFHPNKKDTTREKEIAIDAIKRKDVDGYADSDEFHNGLLYKSRDIDKSVMESIATISEKAFR